MLFRSTCGDTSIKAPELKAWLTKLEPNPDTGKNTLETQFEVRPALWTVVSSLPHITI